MGKLENITGVIVDTYRGSRPRIIPRGKAKVGESRMEARTNLF